MGTFEDKQATNCFICCKNLEINDAASYSSNDVLTYTKMTVINCIKKALRSCQLKQQNKGQWILLLCLECDKIIKDLDHFHHQYTKTQEKLQLVYTEAHSHCHIEDNFEFLEDAEKSHQGQYNDAETRFLQKLSERCSSKRIIKSNPRYTEMPQSSTSYNTVTCSLCGQEYLTKAGLKAHMEGIHANKKFKKGRGRPRKFEKNENSTIFPVIKAMSKDEMVMVAECKDAHDISLSKEKECGTVDGAQKCSVVPGTHTPGTESSSFGMACQVLSSNNYGTHVDKAVKVEQKEVLMTGENEKKYGNLEADELILGANTEDYLITSSECDNLKITEGLIKQSFSNVEKEKKLPRSSDASKKYMCREKCPKCDKVVIGRTKLRRHMLMHSTSYEQKVCEVCGRVLHNTTAYKVHMQCLHGVLPETSTPQIFQSEIDKKKSCQICGKTYRPRYPCDKCPRAHGSYSMICEYCGQTFKLQTQLNSHINSIHRGVTSWACKLCPSKFATHIEYRIHVNKHKRLTYECDICGKQYSWREALKKHKRTKHEYYMSSMSFDCSTVTSSTQSVNTSLCAEDRHDIPELPKVDTEVSVEKIAVGSVLPSGASPAISQNENHSLHVDTDMAPVILGAKLKVTQKGMASGSVMASVVSSANSEIVEKQINFNSPAPSLVSSTRCKLPEKLINSNPVIPLISETHCESDYDRVIDTKGLPLVISGKENNIEGVLPMNPDISDATGRSSDAVFTGAEPQDITGGHVEEVVIVETDASVNYDYIVYHVSS
ncbi:Zinc finger protein 540-like [Homarus americanus]|uniref:Zinc finger protein 540-like n=1 Tax=Homarus americanus TaxID=6706 RepID=A0A8J5JSD5_HOMAM|nr:Zinc finger protein 540-like [Homarus americanus]